jgi:peptidoglycan hydrolase-like protein with peptidoglycan-binding domain
MVLTTSAATTYEAAESARLGEVDRKSSAYIRWVQSSLNQIMNAKLAVDGISGPLTRAAIRSFQSSHGLTADGIVGPITEAAMIAAGAPQPPQTGGGGTTTGPHPSVSARLPSPGAGYYSYKPGTNQYGLPESIQALQAVGSQWHRSHPTGPRIGIGDISLRGGGKMSGHASHQLGVDVDIRLVRNDGREEPTNYKLSTYSRTLTQELVNTIRANGVLRVQYIFFNDAKVTGVQPWPSHDDHVHVRFYPPGSSRERELDEMLGEVNRTSAEYIRWVQSSLNRLQSAGLAVDGISGPLTRAAVRTFQAKHGLDVDAIVGPITEGALMSAGADPPPGWVPPPLDPLTTTETLALGELTPDQQALFQQLRLTIEGYTGVARREGDRGSRVLLTRGSYKVLPQLLPELVRLTGITTLPSGWTLSGTRPLLVGNVLYNLAFPETINQGGTDRLGGKPDPTCFSASTQMLLARRFPVTYVRLTIQLATTNRATFAGGDSIGPLTFKSTNLYRSLESVLLQTAFDTYFSTVAIRGSYTPGDELKVHRQVFGATRPPTTATWGTSAQMVAAFRKAFVTNGGTTRPFEIINLCVGAAQPSCIGNHCIVLSRVQNGRVYFYNPWANEEERNMMWGAAKVSISGHGEHPAESSMTQSDFEGQLSTVFHN